MASNMSTIGFVFGSNEEFQETMIRLAGEAREYHAAGPGEYAIWRSRTGAEIWFHLEGAAEASGGERAIEGLTPFFEGERTIQLVVTGPVRREGYNAFEGAFQAKIGGTGDSAGFPLVFDAVNFAAHTGRKLPARLKAKLAAFAREVKAFPSEEDFKAAQTREPRFAPKAFIPIGMFASAGDPDGQPPSSQALITGRVVETRIFENEATGRAFRWIAVESLEMTIDVVADPEVISDDITPGGTVEVLALLFGRIMS